MTPSDVGDMQIKHSGIGGILEGELAECSSDVQPDSELPVDARPTWSLAFKRQPSPHL